MKSWTRIAVFVDKFPFLGPLVWVLSIQYFVAQIIVAAAWNPAYSWSQNLISDLGNTACGPYGDRFVCSPQHGLMNASFIMLGTTMALGSLLIYQEFRESKLSLIGFSLMAIGGLGAALVGVFPENVVNWLHAVGSLLALGVGNVSLVVLALALTRVRKGLRFYTIITGVVTLVALALYLLKINFGLGQGTMERIVSYPQTIWLVLFGIYMSASHFRHKRSARA